MILNATLTKLATVSRSLAYLIAPENSAPLCCPSNDTRVLGKRAMGV